MAARFPPNEWRPHATIRYEVGFSYGIDPLADEFLFLFVFAHPVELLDAVSPLRFGHLRLARALAVR